MTINIRVTRIMLAATVVVTALAGSTPGSADTAHLQLDASAAVAGPTAGVVVGSGWSWSSYESQTFLTIAATGADGIGSGFAAYRTLTTPLTPLVLDCVAFGSGPLPHSAYASGIDPGGHRVSMTIYDASLTYIADFMAVDVTASGYAPCGAPGFVNRVQSQDEFVVA